MSAFSKCGQCTATRGVVCLQSDGKQHFIIIVYLFDNCHVLLLTFDKLWSLIACLSSKQGLLVRGHSGHNVYNNLFFNYTDQIVMQEYD